MLALSPDGTMVVTATVTHVIDVWDRRTGARLLPSLVGHDGYIERLAVIAPRVAAIRVMGPRGTPVEPHHRRILAVIDHDAWVQDLVVTSDGRTAVSDCLDGTMTIIDLETRAASPPIGAHGRAVDGLP